MYYKRTAGKSGRVHFLDELRGLCVLLMIFYHGAYDLAYIFLPDFPVFRSPAFAALQLFICCNFIFVAGISSRYSHSNIKRGTIVLAAAMTMTLITFFLMPGQIVTFGVLHLLGISMILHGIVFWGTKGEGQPFLSFLICFLLFAFTWGLKNGYVGFFEIYQIRLPDFLYKFYFLSPLGFLSPNFYSSDYFPVLPWIFLFFAGSFFGVYFKRGAMPAFFYKEHIPFLAVVGKRAFVIYLLHQPVIYGVLSLFFMAVNSVA